MFGIGLPELIILLPVLAIFVIGPVVVVYQLVKVHRKKKTAHVASPVPPPFSGDTDHE